MIARVMFDGRYADAFDERGVLLMHILCDGVDGYGPTGFIVRRSSCHWAYDVSGRLLCPPMTSPVFEKQKWGFHDTCLRVVGQ